ncbi:MAG: hypothetical protein LBC88_04545 [Spirochaetaceae bacterium]|jgi:uncharacterized damage-inducible protein DinB|nr:hypothetical protein [Spirochaetaceae bacterium]
MAEPSRQGDAVQETLNHLLEVEAEAQALVNGAEDEAAVRITQAEKRNRAQYDERFAARSAELEAAYERETALIHEAFRKELLEYQAGLESLPRDQDAFNAAVERFFAGEH